MIPRDYSVLRRHKCHFKPSTLNGIAFTFPTRNWLTPSARCLWTWNQKSGHGAGHGPAGALGTCAWKGQRLKLHCNSISIVEVQPVNRSSVFKRFPFIMMVLTCLWRLSSSTSRVCRKRCLSVSSLWAPRSASLLSRTSVCTTSSYNSNMGNFKCTIHVVQQGYEECYTRVLYSQHNHTIWNIPSFRSFIKLVWKALCPEMSLWFVFLIKKK